MALPHFTNIAMKAIKYTTDPIYQNLFEIHFISNDIEDYERDYLIDFTYKIKENRLYLNINNEQGSIKILSILEKLNKFALRVLIHDKTGSVIGKYEYTGCEFVDDILESSIDFDWNSTDILKLDLEFTYNKLEYINACDFKNHLRIKKLERILG